MLNDFDSLFDNVFGTKSLLSGFCPHIRDISECALPADVYTTENGDKVVELAVCGKTKDDFEISTEVLDDGFNGLVIVAKEKENAKEEKEYQVRKIKRSFDKLCLVIEPKYDMEKIKASVENGLLKVVIPVSEQKKRKFVEIA